MNFLGRGLLVATTALLLTAPGFAQSYEAEPNHRGVDVFQTADRDKYGSNVFQTVDPQFMREATQDAMAKIKFARVALQNAQNEQVKAFALQILDDYGQTQEDLFNIAYQEIVLLPNTLDAKHLDTFETLSQLHGAAFDQAYMKAMLHDDQTAALRFKREATKGDAWAGHTLPTLESNFKEAQKVALVVGVPSTVTSAEDHAAGAGKGSTASQQKY